MISDYSKITKDDEVLTLLHSGTVFSVCYRPSEGNIATLLDFLDYLFEFVNNTNFHVVCGGDCNISILVNSTTKINRGTVIISNGCVNVINISTRVTRNADR